MGLRHARVVAFLLSFYSITSLHAAVPSSFPAAVKGTSATAVVLDVKSGRTLALVEPQGKLPVSAPGSILKPLFLAGALKAQAISPETAVFCRRNLHVSAHGRDWNLACSHPRSDLAFSARDALAYSCNWYFASLADRLSPGKVASILEHYGLPASTPQNQAEKELLVLGLAGISVSPSQVAAAYRRLALEQVDAQLQPVLAGLEDSVRFGMAHNADVPGMQIAGKTGTVNGGGWFAGFANLEGVETVVVIYLPGGNGADAAHLAQRIFAASASARPVAESARALTVEVWATKTVDRVTVVSVGSPQAPFTLEWKPDGLHPSQGKAAKEFALSGRLRLEAAGAPEIAAAGKWMVEWKPQGIRLLLTMPSEDYVVAALNGEAAPDEPMESLKAMAITMRTFALVNADRHRSEGFGVCDSTHCQSLRLEKARPEVEKAVRETAGETLWADGGRAHVYYTQHCGGESESAEAVWPEEHAGYLAGKRVDPYCLRRSAAQWHAKISLHQLGEILRDQGWRVPFSIESIRVMRRTVTGRAQLLQVTGQGHSADLSASSFRFAVDRALGWNQIRSDWYELSVVGPDLQITGKGYGHGVGLCQAGAFQMASEGHRAAEILKFYFPGTVAAVSPGDHGWQKRSGAGWTLLTTDPGNGLLKEGDAAWSKARWLFGGPSASGGPVVQELPTTELFRQTTGEPGWMLASTRGEHVFLQPRMIRESHGGTGPLLLHEFLHVMVEMEAGEKAPLWLREGLVEILADPDFERPVSGLSPWTVDAALQHPADADASRQAHRSAAQLTAMLRARYGLAAVKSFLRNGVPAEALRFSR